MHHGIAHHQQGSLINGLVQGLSTGCEVMSQGCVVALENELCHCVHVLHKAGIEQSERFVAAGTSTMASTTSTTRWMGLKPCGASTLT